MFTFLIGIVVFLIGLFFGSSDMKMWGGGVAAAAAKTVGWLGVLIGSAIVVFGVFLFVKTGGFQSVDSTAVDTAKEVIEANE